MTVIGAEKFMRGGLEAELEDLTVPMPEGRLARCNFSSIAAATGLNRETVRRKVNWLIEAGILEKETTGALRATPAVTGHPAVQQLVTEQVELVRRLHHY